MRKSLLILTALIFSLLAILGNHLSHAQGPTSTPSQDCNPGDLITQFSKLTPSGNAEKDIATLLKMRTQITNQNIACHGMTFSGKGGGITEPFNLPAGSYRFTVVIAPKGFVADLEGVTDEWCATGGLNDNTSSNIVRTKGCMVVLKVRLYEDTGNWLFKVEPLK